MCRLPNPRAVGDPTHVRTVMSSSTGITLFRRIKTTTTHLFYSYSLTILYRTRPESPANTLNLTGDDQVTANEDGTAHFEGFQVSKQCMEMVAEGALDVGERFRCSATLPASLSRLGGGGGRR